MNIKKYNLFIHIGLCLTTFLVLTPVVHAAVCGTADRAYPVGSTSFGGDTFCAVGTPHDTTIARQNYTPVFPTVSAPITDWLCIDELSLIDYCTAVLSTANYMITKSTQWNRVENGLANVLYWYNSVTSSWWPALSDRMIIINYNVGVTNASTSAVVPDNSNVMVGNTLKFSFLPHRYTDIYWFGTGYSSDTPYGEWRAGAAPPSASCAAKDLVGPDGCGGNINIYIPLVVSPPTKTITNTTGMSCGSLTGNETNGYSMICTVTSCGTLSPSFNFASTYGEFYHRWMGTAGGSPCHASNVALQLDNSGVFIWCTPTTATTNYNLNVDLQTIPYTLNVPCPLSSVSCSVAPTQANIGNTINWSSITTGGTGPYTYSWTGNAFGAGSSMASCTSSACSPTYTTTGVKSGTVTVTDSLSATATSSACTTTIRRPVTAFCTVKPRLATTNQTIEFTAHPGGGEAGGNPTGYTYNWSGTNGVNGLQIVTTWFTTSNTYHASVTVTDTATGNTFTAPAGECNVVVNSGGVCL